MRVLAVIDPPGNLRPRSDTTVALVDELLRRGHETFVCQVQDLWLRHEVAGATVYAVTGTDRENRPALTLDATAKERALGDFHAVLMRKDPPYDIMYHFATLLLERARGQTLLVNDPRGLREANEKLYIFHFPDLLAPTRVTRRIDELRAFMAELGGQMIVKPLDGYAGLSVFHVRQDDDNTGSILETMTQHEQRWVMAQKYLDIARCGDKRILMLDGEPIGALLRMPAQAEVRSNLALGGTAKQTELTARDLEICARLRPKLLEDGLHFVGIDVIDGHLTEVNVTSPTGVQAVNRLYGIRLESKIVDFLEARAPHKA